MCPDCGGEYGHLPNCPTLKRLQIRAPLEAEVTRLTKERDAAIADRELARREQFIAADHRETVIGLQAQEIKRLKAALLEALGAWERLDVEGRDWTRRHSLHPLVDLPPSGSALVQSEGKDV